MEDFFDRLLISRPTSKMLLRANITLSQFYHISGWEKFAGGYTLPFWNDECRNISSVCDVTSVSFFREKCFIYAIIFVEDKWSYEEKTREKCELNIEQRIPQSLALHSINRKVGEIFDGIDPISQETIEKVKVGYNHTEILLLTEWLQISQQTH